MTVWTHDRRTGGYGQLVETTQVSTKRSAVSTSEGFDQSLVIVLERAAVALNGRLGGIRQRTGLVRSAESDVTEDGRAGVVLFLRSVPERTFSDARRDSRIRPRL